MHPPKLDAMSGVYCAGKDERLKMNEEKVRSSWIKAKIFVLECEIVMEKNKTDRDTFFTGCKETGQLRRTSMDLTRSLAELRKSD